MAELAGQGEKCGIIEFLETDDRFPESSPDPAPCRRTANPGQPVLWLSGSVLSRTECLEAPDREL